MSSTTVRISKKSRDALRRMAVETGRPLSAVLEAAVEAYRRRGILERTNAAYAALRADPAALQNWQTEARRWDVALTDGVPS